jgi:hypothetical protein
MNPMHPSDLTIAMLITLGLLYYPILFGLGLGALWLVVAVVASAIRFGQPRPPLGFGDLPDDDLAGLPPGPEPLVEANGRAWDDAVADPHPQPPLHQAPRQRGRRRVLQ